MGGTTMTNKPNLRDDLLKQNGTSAGASAGIRDKILAEDQRRVRHMRWLATRCWVVFLLFLLIWAYLKYDCPLLGARATEDIRLIFSGYPWIVSVIVFAPQALFILAVALTLSLYLRSRTLTMHQIQASLTGIEEQLKKLAEKG
jgi:hypothetical protein